MCIIGEHPYTFPQMHFCDMFLCLLYYTISFFSIPVLGGLLSFQIINPWAPFIFPFLPVWPFNNLYSRLLNEIGSVWYTDTFTKKAPLWAVVIFCISVCPSSAPESESPPFLCSHREGGPRSPFLGSRESQRHLPPWRGGPKAPRREPVPSA